jgi:hypothetical protein
MILAEGLLVDLDGATIERLSLVITILYARINLSMRAD